MAVQKLEMYPKNGIDTEEDYRDMLKDYIHLLAAREIDDSKEGEFRKLSQRMDNYEKDELFRS